MTCNKIARRHEGIWYEKGAYFARVVPAGYDVYKTGPTAATRVAQIGYKGAEGMRRVIAEIDRRIQVDNNQ